MLTVLSGEERLTEIAGCFKQILNSRGAWNQTALPSMERMTGSGMGEIKSTLDLVMERTRHLSLSAEEKARQQEEDFTRRLQGLLQQYADGALTVDRLRDRIGALQAELHIDDHEPVLTAVAARIDPEQDHRPWLVLLADLAPGVGQALEATLTAFQKEKADLTTTSVDGLREAIARRHGIVGSAVIPNPAADGAFLEKLAALRQKTHDRIADLVRQTD